MSRKSSAVSDGRSASSIWCSRKFAAYCGAPIARSQPARSTRRLSCCRRCLQAARPLALAHFRGLRRTIYSPPEGRAATPPAAEAAQIWRSEPADSTIAPFSAASCASGPLRMTVPPVEDRAGPDPDGPAKRHRQSGRPASIGQFLDGEAARVGIVVARRPAGSAIRGPCRFISSSFASARTRSTTSASGWRRGWPRRSGAALRSATPMLPA